VKLLLDENVPVPMTSTVKTLLRRSHDVQHVTDMPGWSGTKDLHLYGKAKDAGYEVVVTNDAKQMNRKLEVEAIAKSGLHRQERCAARYHRAQRLGRPHGGARQRCQRTT
jgi:predicted nuclease of predicted toxin-antitoxin system